jgi:hypothetical protein
MSFVIPSTLYYNSSAGDSTDVNAPEKLVKKQTNYYYNNVDIPELPTRLWPLVDGKTPDLREAHGLQEVTVAANRIDNIKDYEGVVDNIGERTGVLFNTVKDKWWGRKYADKMEVIEQAQFRIERMEGVMEEIRRYPGVPPAELVKFVKNEIEAAESAKAMFVFSFNNDIKNVRLAIREANIALRHEDLNKHWYGKVTLRGLSEKEKKERRQLQCALCEVRGHLAYDHWWWKCAVCGEKAPHHSPYKCRIVANEKERAKKAKGRKAGAYKDSKYDLPEEWSSEDNGWSTQADLGWAGPYPAGDEAGEVEEHPYTAFLRKEGGRIHL